MAPEQLHLLLCLILQNQCKVFVISTQPWKLVWNVMWFGYQLMPEVMFMMQPQLDPASHMLQASLL